MRGTLSPVGRYVNWTRSLQLPGHSTSGECARVDLANTGMNMRSFICLLILVAATAASGCSTVPHITRERTTMSVADIEAEGLVCRKDRQPDTNIPRTICASEEAWAAFDERRRHETDDLLAEGRKATNGGWFQRD
jgi:hypothetical protein